ncbi:MAG: hypothetical protein SVG88_05215 [Halobacteriales archaeon]|nr:hypothetical protein [Halobacteriales archaeon]
MYKRVALGLSMVLIGVPMLFAATAPLGLLLVIAGGFLVGLPHLHSGGRETTDTAPETTADSESTGSTI